MKKNVIVTGSASGIGLEVVHYLKKNGYCVYGLDINKSEITENFFQGDISEQDFLTEVYSKINGPIDALINNAAIQIEKTFLETSTTEWKKVFEVNVFGTFLTSKIFVPKIKEFGSIVNISSVHSRATSIGMCAYVASKSAISGMTRAMALELGERNIRVNSIVPGAIDTPMLERGLKRNQNQKTALDILKKSSPLKKIGSPNDVAKLISFLIDPNLSGNITGSEFSCDSGILAKLASE